MKVVCINKYGRKYLTEGKTYEVIKIDDDGDYWIIDDTNNKWCFLKKCFKPLYEIRNEKINRLLE